MEDASSITSLPDDPRALKQIIIDLSRQRDENARQRDGWRVKFQNIEIEKLRLEMQLLRLRKWYYGPPDSKPLATWLRCCWLSPPSWNRGL